MVKLPGLKRIDMGLISSGEGPLRNSKSNTYPAAVSATQEECTGGGRVPSWLLDGPPVSGGKGGIWEVSLVTQCGGRWG